MASSSSSSSSSLLIVYHQLGIILLFLSSICALDAAPNGCRNDYQSVMINSWVNGAKQEPLSGLSAAFGSVLPAKLKHAQRLPAALSQPLNSCSSSSSRLSGSIALGQRGDCEFTTKANIAQEGGAAGLVVINTDEGDTQMGCGANDTSLNITIPVVAISKSAGEELIKSITSGVKVELLLYSPVRPKVDYSVVFLWLMAVGTVVSSSLWSEFTGSGKNEEPIKELSSKEYDAATAKDDEEEEVLNLSAKSAIVFVISASIFLVLLYFFMSTWFIWVLIVLFSIGGVEGMHGCIVSLVSSKCKSCVRKTVNMPLIGETSIFSLVVLILCIAFAVSWAVKRKASYAWAGQDILGICMMITVFSTACDMESYKVHFERAFFISGFVETLVPNKIHPLKKDEEEKEQQNKMNNDEEAMESKGPKNQERDDNTIALRPNEALDLGPSMSCPMQKQQQNQGGKSTPKKKELVLERIITSSVPESKEPDVQIVSFSIVCPGRPEIALTHPFTSSPKACLFTLKEGTKYRLKFAILVSNKVVSGLKYENTLWKSCVRVDKSTVLLGTFNPRKNPYVYQFQEDTLPTGILVRGLYTAKAKVVDSEGKCHMDIRYHFDIQKNWPSTS